jgi:peptide deformylase
MNEAKTIADVNGNIIGEKKVKELVAKSDPILRTATKKFDFSNPPINPVELYNELGNALLHYEGLGLAANQLGYEHSVFVIWSDPIRAFFNPVLVDASKEVVELDEACLTFPGIYAKITRPTSVKIRYADPTGKVLTEKFTHMTARVIQHEMDHLAGKLFTQRLSRLQLEMAIKRAKKQGENYIIKDLL